MRKLRVNSLIGGAACAAVCLAGCGGSGGSPFAATSPGPAGARSSAATKVAVNDGPALAKSMEDSLKQVSSLRVTGTIVKGGSTKRVDLAMDHAGHTVGTLENGKQGFKLISTDANTTYLLGNTAFWKSAGGQAAVTLFSGKWLKATGAKARQITGDLSLHSMISQLTKDSAAKLSKVRAGAPEKIDGQLAVPLSGMPRDGDSYDSTVWVQAGGKHYPLRVRGDGSHSDNYLEFSDFNKPVKATPPPAAQTVDLAQLEQLSA